MLAIASAVQARFESSQSPSENHKALCLALKRDHAEALAAGADAEFSYYFSRCLDRILPLARTDLTSIRITDFVVQYASLLVGDSDTEVPEDPNLDRFFLFVDMLIERYTKWIDHKLTPVRFHCVQIVSRLLQHSEISDEIYDQIVDKLIVRLRDSDPHVRKEAALRLCSFETMPSITNALLDAMSHDPSSEVRLVITYNIAHEDGVMDQVLKRMRDITPSLRRMLFRKVLTSFDVETLSIKTRVNIVMCGLTDSNEGVRWAAKNLISLWIAAANNDVPRVLKGLDPVVNTEAADLVLNAFFEMRPDVIEMLAHPRRADDIDEEDYSFLTYGFTAPFFENIAPDDVLVLRGFQEFCMRHRRSAELESGMPDLYILASEIDKLVQKQWHPEDIDMSFVDDEAEWRENLPFMIEQLLLVASRYDVDDEAGRQRLTEISNNIILSREAPSEKVIEYIATIQKRLNAESDRAFVSWAFETLNLNPSVFSQDTATQEMASQDVGGVVTEMLRAVALFKHVLSLVSSHDVVEWLPSLYEEHIFAPLHSPVRELHVPALECLALACLLNDSFAEEHFDELWKAAEVAKTVQGDDIDDLLIREVTTGISGICDIILNTDRSMDNSGFRHTNNTPASNNSDSSQILNSLGDDSVVAPEHLVEFPYSKLESIIQLLEFLLESESKQVQNLASTSLSKLLLSGRIIEEDEVLQRLLEFYFRNEPYQAINDSAGLTQQQLTLFLRAYTMFDKGKLAIAMIFKSVCMNFLRVKSAEKLSVSLGDVFVHLLTLTAPVPNQDNQVEAASAHAIIATILLEWVFMSDNASQRRSAAHALGSVVLESTSLGSVRELLSMVDSHEAFLDDKPANIRNLVTQFRERLQAINDRVPVQSAGSDNGLPPSSQSTNLFVDNNNVVEERVVPEDGMNVDIEV